MVVSVRDLSYESIAVGTEVAHRYTISAAVHARFIEAFEDVSPIHVDAGYARARGFNGKVMHGAILNGFVSNLVGVHFPGRRALLLSVELRFANPSYVDDIVEIRAAVTQKVDAQRVIVLKLEIDNVTQGTTAATGRAQVRLAEA